MQMHLTLSGSQTILPLSYQTLVHGAIYHALTKESGYGSQLHNTQPGADHRTFKGFCFGALTGPYTIMNGKIMFHNQIQLDIRSIDPYFILSLASAWPVGSDIRLADQQLRIVSGEITDTHITQRQINVSMLSPVAVYRTLDNGKTEFYAPDDPRFYTALVHNAQRKWQTFYDDDSFDFSITPLFSGLPKRVFTVFKKTYITGWKGEYRLRGDPAVLDMLYQVGLGVKNSEGFGMFRTNFSARNRE